MLGAGGGTFAAGAAGGVGTGATAGEDGVVVEIGAISVAVDAGLAMRDESSPFRVRPCVTQCGTPRHAPAR